MPSHRETIIAALLTAVTTCWVTAVVLVGDGHVVPAVTLFVAGAAAVSAGLWMMFHKPKRKPLPREIADLFARSGSFMGEPPRYDSSLRQPPP